MKCDNNYEDAVKKILNDKKCMPVCSVCIGPTGPTAPMT